MHGLDWESTLERYLPLVERVTTRDEFADPYLEVEDGDVIEQVNGVDVLSVPHIGALLRNQIGKQVPVPSGETAPGFRDRAAECTSATATRGQRRPRCWSWKLDTSPM